MTDTLMICGYLLVMAGVTYLIRALPLVAFRRTIRSAYLRSMLFYLPYAVLSAMVLPSVFSSTGSVVTAAAGFVAAVVLAFFGRSLIVVALGASATAFAVGFLMQLFI
ncbi:MAG: AzlD domain-containing protein [Eubacteriales bacterium]|nr:AzlD domain-containing protein [Eubacteriales bacterium]